METVDLMPAIKEGYWFYGGLTICPVRIVKHHTLFGTNDPSDPPEISFDKKTELLLRALSPARLTRELARWGQCT